MCSLLCCLAYLGACRAEPTALQKKIEARGAAEGMDDWVGPAWLIGAALVRPARASAILKPALDAESHNVAAGLLASYLWRIAGLQEKDTLVDWFGKNLDPEPSPAFNEPAFFLRDVQVAGRKDAHDLLAALIKDPRFEQSNWEVLKEMLAIANAGRPHPLVENAELYRETRQPAQCPTFQSWRSLLRKAYDVR